MDVAIDYELGRKTFFWYRVYLASLGLLYLLIAVAGTIAAMYPFEGSKQDRDQLFMMGIIYAIVGTIFFIIFAIAFFLPAKPYNWVVGIVMLAIGMTSCCLWPAVIPLLIFWIKPETQAFLGRKQPS